MPATLAELAASVGGRVVGDGSVRIARVGSVDDAGSDALTFATDERYLAAALAGSAAAVLVEAAIASEPASKPLLIVENVRHALAQVLASFAAAPSARSVPASERGYRIGRAARCGRVRRGERVRRPARGGRRRQRRRYRRVPG